ncbi:MAG TPA: hypothetical protein VNN09_05200 [Candidatus Competibacteraceae bacterium]|nr:hypothetical protein [Candidatus Competibacteraceae bacterium]
MSVALYAVLEQELPGMNAAILDGKALARASEELYALAERLGVLPLAAFFSAGDEVLDFLDDGMLDEDLPETLDALEELDDLQDHLQDLIDPTELDEPGDAAATASEWFEPAAGLSTVRALLEHLRAQPEAVPQADGVCADLEALAEILERAAAAGVRWRLAVDF